MSQQIEKLAVMFADVCDSTSLYEQVGDIKARQLISWCVHTMSQEVTQFRGQLIKTIGDEIMCTFPDAESAFNAACAMQNAIQSKRPEEGIAMHIRVGFHYGDVICENNDVFGDTVNVAARIASLARTEQVMISQAVQDALPVHLQSHTCRIMNAELKGKHEKYPIFLAIWEKDDTEHTRFNSTVQRRDFENNPSTKQQELSLSYQGYIFKINAEHPNLLLGRSDECDLIIQNGFVSRRHVRLELRFGKFILIDQSTNGTYLQSSSGNITHVVRQEIILQDSGYFCLGQSKFDNQNELIKFSIY